LKDFFALIISFGVVLSNGISLVSFVIVRWLISIGVAEIYERGDGDHLSSGALGVMHANDCW